MKTIDEIQELIAEAFDEQSLDGPSYAALAQIAAFAGRAEGLTLGRESFIAEMKLVVNQLNEVLDYQRCLMNELRGRISKLEERDKAEGRPDG